MAMHMLRTILRKTGLTSRLYHIVNSLYPPFNSLHPFNLLALVKSFQRIKEINLTGDYYEFGIFSGFSFWFAYQLGEEYSLNTCKSTNFWGFDSFDGLPNPRGIDKATDYFGNNFAKGSFAVSLDLVKDNLERNKVDMNRVKLIKGFYEDVLNDDLFNKYDFKKASVILIDCDMYASTVSVLKFITRLITKGTIILFDDYYVTNKDAGQRLAIKEWLDFNKNIRLEDFCEYGVLKGFVVDKI